jgi:hypothetical protein
LTELGWPVIFAGPDTAALPAADDPDDAAAEVAALLLALLLLLDELVPDEQAASARPAAASPAMSFRLRRTLFSSEVGVVRTLPVGKRMGRYPAGSVTQSCR